VWNTLKGKVEKPYQGCSFSEIRMPVKTAGFQGTEIALLVEWME
jgi:hypothetical protein